MQPRLSEGLREMQPRLSEGLREMQPRLSEGLREMQPRLSEGLRGMQPRLSVGLRGMQPRLSVGLRGMQPRLSDGLRRMQPRLSEGLGGACSLDYLKSCKTCLAHLTSCRTYSLNHLNWRIARHGTLVIWRAGGHAALVFWGADILKFGWCSQSWLIQRLKSWAALIGFMHLVEVLMGLQSWLSWEWKLSDMSSLVFLKIWLSLIIWRSE